MKTREMISNLWCNHQQYNDLVMYILKNEVWNHPDYYKHPKEGLLVNIRYIQTDGILYNIMKNEVCINTGFISFTNLVSRN